MRILLVPSKTNYPDPRPSNDIFGQGLPYLAGSLISNGHDVFGMNINYRWCHGSAQWFLESSLRAAIREYQPDLIGIGGLSSDYIFIRDLIRFVRTIAPKIKIVCGGGIITYDRHYIFEDLKPDYALCGDAEESLLKLVTCLERGGDLSLIENLSFFHECSPVYTEIKYTDAPLDDLPFPEYGIFDIEGYYELANQRDNSFYGHTRLRPRIMPLTLGRSCPFKCTFCCHQGGPTYRSRSIDNAVAEIVSMYECYRFNLLLIYDELFGFHKNTILEFCKKISEARLQYSMDFDWSCVLRVTCVDTEVLEKMKASGCIYVGYGLESASPDVLSSMKKEITVRQIEDAICRTEAAGLGVQGNFIFGDIAETADSIKETASFFKKWCRHHMVNFGFVTPYPGSRIFDSCREKGIIVDKREFYQTIGGFGKACFNMTSLPDSELFAVVESLTHEIDLSTILPLSADRTGIRNFDTGAPFTERRSTYLIRTKCPHCDQETEYVFPLLDAKAPAEEWIATVCSSCHKRFQVIVTKVPLPQEQAAPFFDDRIITSSLLQAFVPQLIQSVQGYNFLAYDNFYYAVPWFLGPVDLKKKETRQHVAIVSAASWHELYTRVKQRRFWFIYWALTIKLTRIAKASMSRIGLLK